MYINSVRATAFGPLRGLTLNLLPGLNVFHGPNEAGKSSWFAATYAGLAGRRRQRGRGTTAQAEFQRRHKPWSGSRWSAGVILTLDSGLTLAIEHDLARGESRIVDSAAGRPITVVQLEQRLDMPLITEATLDGTRLLGLNRDSARTTIFTGQADILRVHADAAELQELLERAATTQAADATADGALTWLTARRSDWVGSASVGNRPLRARRIDLEKAQAATRERRDGLARLVEAIVDRQRIDTALRQAQENLEFADRVLRWREVHELRARVDQAVRLSAEVGRSAEEELWVDEDRVRVAAAVLGAFDAGTDVPPLPAGPSTDDIQAEIDTLPDQPDGDLEPRSEVVTAHRELARAQTALTTHLDTAPADRPDGTETPLSSDELRALADTLEAPVPVVDPALGALVANLRQRAQAAADAHAAAREHFDAATARNEERLRVHAEAVATHARAMTEFDRLKHERTTLFEALRRAAEEAAVAYARDKAAHDAIVRQNEEKRAAHDQAVADHVAALAEFERLRAERTQRFETLRRQAAEADAAYVAAKAVHDGASARNAEALRAHAAAVDEYQQALAEFQHTRAEFHEGDSS